MRERGWLTGILSGRFRGSLLGAWGRRGAAILLAWGALGLGAPPAAAQGTPPPLIDNFSWRGPVRQGVDRIQATSLDEGGRGLIIELTGAVPTPRPNPVTLVFSVTGTAATNADMTFPMGFPSLPVNAYTRNLGTGANLQFDFSAIDDNDIEGPEELTFTINEIASPSDRSVVIGSPSVVTVTINDGDSGTVSIARDLAPAFQFMEGGAGDAARAAFTVSVAGGTPTAAVIVPYTLSGVDAADVGVPLRGTISIPAGSTSARLLIPAAEDAQAEGDETLTVTLGAASTTAGTVQTATAPGNAATAVLRDNDTAVGIGAPSPGRAAEGGSFVFPLRFRGSTPTASVTVDYSIAGDGVTPSDFMGLSGLTGPPRTFTPSQIAAGGTNLNITVTTADDTSVEADETFAVTIAVAQPPGSTVSTAAANRATATIVENDIGIALSPPPASVVEGETAVFTVTRSGARGVPVTVDYAVSGVDAADFRDPGGGSVTLPADATSARIELAIVPDGVTEGDETLAVTLSLPAGTPPTVQILAAGSATVTIPRLDIAVAVSGPEAAQEGTVARFAVSLAIEPEGEVTPVDLVLGYALDPGGTDSATPGRDYRGPPGGEGELRIPAGQAGGTIEVPVLRDGELEAEEVFSLTLVPGRSTGGGGGLRIATPVLRVRILDGADQAARREQRTRGMLAATHRAAAHMAADVITARFHPDASVAPPPDAAAAEGAAARDDRSAGLRVDLGSDPHTALPPPAAAAEPPTFGQLLGQLGGPGRSHFALRGDALGWDRVGEGLSLWGAGVFTSLEGDPTLGGGRLDYEGESYGAFLGVDQRIELDLAGAERSLLAGAALGWTRGDLDFRDRAQAGFERAGRFESELFSVHPYASLRLSPRAQLWLVAGFGWGEVEIREGEGAEAAGASRAVETDTTMWMVSAGAEGRVPLPLDAASELLVRLWGTRTGGSLDRARFDDGALLRGTRARTWRVAGELEGSHRWEFSGGGPCAALCDGPSAG